LGEGAAGRFPEFARREGLAREGSTPRGAVAERSPNASANEGVTDPGLSVPISLQPVRTFPLASQGHRSLRY